MNEMKRLTTFLPGFGGFHGTKWANLFPFSLWKCAERFARYEDADELTAAELDAIARDERALALLRRTREELLPPLRRRHVGMTGL